MKPQCGKIFTFPGPQWGRMETRGTTQISTRRKVTAVPKGWPSYMGVLGGRLPLSGGDVAQRQRG